MHNKISFSAHAEREMKMQVNYQTKNCCIQILWFAALATMNIV